ncbi:t-SNARE, partial [Chytridium lagenaria]
QPPHPLFPDRSLFGQGPKGNTMEAFFEEVESLQRGYRSVQQKYSRIRHLQGKSLTASSSAEAQLLQTLRTRLKALSNATKQLPKSPEAHSEEDTVDVGNKIMDAARTFQQCQAISRQRQSRGLREKSRSVRTRPDATPAEIERAIEGGGGFAQQLLSSRVADQRRLLNDVQNRHNEMQKIEQSLEELLNLFQEMEALIDSQQDMINNIEVHAETAVINLEEGSKEMSKAITYRKSTRKKMWWIIVIVLVLLAVIAFVVWFYFFRNQNNNNNNGK